MLASLLSTKFIRNFMNFFHNFTDSKRISVILNLSITHAEIASTQDAS